MLRRFFLTARNRVTSWSLAVYIASPRILLAAALAAIAFLAFLVLCAPVELVCSSEGGAFCSAASYAGPWWFEAIGGFVQNVILCDLSQTDCKGGMQIADIQSVAQLLFGYTLTLNWVNGFWEHYTKSLSNIKQRLSGNIIADSSETDPSDEADFIGLVEARLQTWLPFYRFAMSTTFAFVRAAYIFTAFASACILLLTFIDKSQQLPFKVPQAIIFALGPLMALGLLSLIFGILENLIDRCIIPGVLSRRSRYSVLEKNLYGDLDVPGGSDNSGATA